MTRLDTLQCKTADPVSMHGLCTWGPVHHRLLSCAASAPWLQAVRTYQRRWGANEVCLMAGAWVVTTVAAAAAVAVWRCCSCWCCCVHTHTGLPRPTVSWWLPLDNFRELAPLALVVMLVDLLESTSIARALAAKGKYELNANQVPLHTPRLSCWAVYLLHTCILRPPRP